MKQKKKKIHSAAYVIFYYLRRIHCEEEICVKKNIFKLKEENLMEIWFLKTKRRKNIFFFGNDFSLVNKTVLFFAILLADTLHTVRVRTLPIICT